MREMVARTYMDSHGRRRRNEVQKPEQSPPSYLNNLVCPRGQQPSSGGIKMHVHNVMFAVMEGGGGRTSVGSKESFQESKAVVCK